MAERLRIGVIGGGNIARRLHLPTWIDHPDAEVVAVADPSPVALEDARTVSGLDESNSYTDPAELIAREDVDVVDVCTPPLYRPELIAAAARAGKHVLAEKPLAVTPAEGQVAVDAARTAGVILGMGHNYLFLDEIRAVREAIASGVIGQVRTATVNYLGVEYVPGKAGDWRRDIGMSGGGVLMDLIHAIYVVESFLGEEIDRVSAWMDHHDPTSNIEDLALCRFETANKAGLVNIGWGWGDGHIDVAGTEGRISVWYQDGGTAPWAPLEKVTVTTAEGTRTILGPEEPRPATYDEFPPMAKTFPLLIDDFVSAIRQGGTPLSQGSDGLRMLEGAIAAYASYATGQTLTLPLDRNSPLFTQGTLGVPELQTAKWSPLERVALFRTDPNS